MKHSTKYEGKVGIERLPISEDETMILHNFFYREIQEDQDGEKYFIGATDRAIYFDTVPLPQPKDESKEVKEGGELFTGGEWEMHPFSRTKFEMCLMSVTNEGQERFCTLDFRDIESIREVEANAALIAQAPAMYKLIQWISRVTNNPEIGIKCDAMIRKATPNY